MKYALIGVIAVGAIVGMSMPGGKRAAVTPTAPPLSGEANSPVSTAGSPVAAQGSSPTSSYGQETVLERGLGGHFFTVANINGEPIRFVVDTGATDVALTMDDARRAGISFDPSQFEVVGSGASGDVRGQVVELREVDLDGKKVSDIHAVVLEGLTVSLLGQNYLRHLDNVSISGDKMTLR
jgi:aspartyl protease family protein